jgi:hypothetical protein
LAALAPPEGSDPPPADTSEFLKPKKESAAILAVWNKTVGSGSLGPQLSSLQQFVLPLPGSALKLLFAIALLLNYDPVTLQDVGGDVTWDLYKKVNYPLSFFSVS